ncbi:hypothetical protein JZ751_027176 [Albula glossodonta]|uniref:KHDC4/BBP-like KH-domain type I domain-containing protein n=1 Tax=Albula glossodonta TaxID=121402 RepID=A0A8T2MVY4_9TELE|nr:hypothetical protein JZ751_027176 [Albula glossodonta]
MLHTGGAAAVAGTQEVTQARSERRRLNMTAMSLLIPATLIAAGEPWADSYQQNQHPPAPHPNLTAQRTSFACSCLRLVHGSPARSDESYVVARSDCAYNFVGRILGPRGLTAKQLEAETGCKIMVRGKSSMRDRKKLKIQTSAKPKVEGNCVPSRARSPHVANMGAAPFPPNSAGTL